MLWRIDGGPLAWAFAILPSLACSDDLPSWAPPDAPAGVVHAEDAAAPVEVDARATTPPPADAGPPVLEALEPAVFEVRNEWLELVARGSGFERHSYVLYDGVPLSADFRSERELAVTIFPPLGPARSVPVVIRTAHGTSDTLILELRNPVPTLEGASWGFYGDEITLYVNGTGFVESSELLWNGAPREAEVDVGVLWGSISSVFSREELDGTPCTVQVRTPPPGGGLSGVWTCPMRVFPRKVEMSPYRLVWDPRRRRLYASEAPPPGQPPAEGRIAVIDPVKGSIVRHIVVGPSTGALALSDDGRYLYVGESELVAGSTRVRRMDLDTETVDLEFEVPRRSAGDEGRPSYFAIAPTLPSRVAVSFRGNTASSSELAVYDDGRPLAMPECYGCGISVFSSDATLHAINNSDTFFEFHTFDISGGVVTRRSVRPNAVPGFVAQLARRDHLAFLATFGPSSLADSVGAVLDLSTGSLVGTITGSRSIAIDDAAGLVYMADDFVSSTENTATVWISDLSSYRLLRTFEVWGVYYAGFIEGFVQWGSDQLALSKPDGVYLVRVPAE